MSSARVRLLMVPACVGARLAREYSNGPRPGAPAAVDRIDFDEAGRTRLSGVAAPNATLRVYLDNKLVGIAEAVSCACDPAARTPVEEPGPPRVS